MTAYGPCCPGGEDRRPKRSGLFHAAGVRPASNTRKPQVVGSGLCLGTRLIARSSCGNSRRWFVAKRSRSPMRCSRKLTTKAKLSAARSPRRSSGRCHGCADCLDRVGLPAFTQVLFVRGTVSGKLGHATHRLKAPVAVPNARRTARNCGVSRPIRAPGRGGSPAQCRLFRRPAQRRLFGRPAP